LDFPEGLAVDTANNEIVVANIDNNSITVYSRTATGNVAPLRTISGGATGLSDPAFPAISTSPTATVTLSGSGFHTGQTITYEARLTPGSSPTQVDIYLGCLLPDGATFLSLIQVSPGIVTFSLGPAPIPFLAGVLLTPLVVPFSHTFTGTEPIGTYFAYAGLAVAGSNPVLPANQLALNIQPFQFSP
jgi:DNA-binding beta-propeller fold protein YncE